MSVFIHNTIFVIQNGVKRNEESVENQCGSSFVRMTKLLYFQTYDKLRTFKCNSIVFLRSAYVVKISRAKLLTIEKNSSGVSIFG